MKVRRRLYWAIEKPYGLDTLNVSGNQANRLRSFATSGERDAWVAKNTAIRVAVKASQGVVRKANRDFAIDLPCEISFMD